MGSETETPQRRVPRTRAEIQEAYRQRKTEGSKSFRINLSAEARKAICDKEVDLKDPFELGDFFRETLARLEIFELPRNGQPKIRVKITPRC